MGAKGCGRGLAGEGADARRRQDLGQRRGGAGWARFTVGPCRLSPERARAGQDGASPALIMRVQVRMDVRPGQAQAHQ